MTRYTFDYHEVHDGETVDLPANAEIVATQEFAEHSGVALSFWTRTPVVKPLPDDMKDSDNASI